MNDQLLEKNALLESVINGRLDFMRSYAVLSPLPYATFNETNDSALYCMGIDFATCNGILEREEFRHISHEEIEKTIQFFSDRKLPFIWWTSDKNLENRGFQHGGVLKGIAVDISQKVMNYNVPSKIIIKKAQSKEDIKAFSELAFVALGMHAPLEQLEVANEAVMKNNEHIHYLALIDDHPVGIATLSVFSQSAGIWNLGTLPEYRKQGVATALVHTALLEAKKRHYNHVMAILMPKGLAWGVFTQLGFNEVCQFPFYVYGVSADSLEK